MKTPAQKLNEIIKFCNDHNSDISRRANEGDDTCIKIVGTVMRIKQYPRETGNIGLLAHLLDLYKEKIGDTSPPFITGVELKE